MSIDYKRGATDTIKHATDISEWYTEYPKLKYNFFKLPEYYSFDLEKIRLEVENVLLNYEPQFVKRNSAGKAYTKYAGLGFYSRKNSKNPLNDHFVRRDKMIGEVYPDNLHLQKTLPDLIEDDFTEETDILTPLFRSLFSKFKSNINKASLLLLKSKGFLGSHVDFPYYKTVRLHATIFESPGAWYEIDGEQIQIPADGNWYFIDTGKFHSVWNDGPVDRLTLNINLSSLNGDPLTLAESKDL